MLSFSFFINLKAEPTTALGCKHMFLFMDFPGALSVAFRKPLCSSSSFLICIPHAFYPGLSQILTTLRPGMEDIVPNLAQRTRRLSEGREGGREVCGSVRATRR